MLRYSIWMYNVAPDEIVEVATQSESLGRAFNLWDALAAST